MTNKTPKLSIIVPCYNEEEVLKDTAHALRRVLEAMIKKNQISLESEICFVSDGSRDKTWAIIKRLNRENKHFKGIKLSRNFGHQGALLAGLFSSVADVFVTIDADLQDDEKAIPKMVENFKRGFEVVYGVRRSRQSDSFFKRFSAEGFYKLLKILRIKVVFNHADFRLMSQKAVEALKTFPEKNLFLRAMVPLLGFKSARVFFDRKMRRKGQSKYPFSKMSAFAWDGITSFSISPLRLVTIMGILTFFISLLLIVYSIYRFLAGETVIGWTSLVTVVAMFSGVQLISLGIIGEYIGKIYQETKNRPNFIVEEKIT